MSVTLIGGGIGCVRLAVPLADALDDGGLTIVVNTGDDLWRYGLRICPDLDTNLYGLGGVRDRDRGWGLAGESFRTMEQLRRLGEDPWFNLGDLDMATHLLRTAMLRDGATLTEVTAHLMAAHLVAASGVAARLLPATDDEVATRVVTDRGELSFQEYFVQHRAEPTVSDVRFDGAADAAPAPGVLPAVEDAELVILGPSNPVASLGPVFAVPGIREALERRVARGAATVAVTSVVNGVPITEEGEARRARCRAAMMAARGVDHSAAGVGALLVGLAATIVSDRVDGGDAAALAAMGYRVLEADTVPVGADLVGALLAVIA